MMNKKSKDKKQKTLENENEEEGGRGKASNNRNDNKQSTGMSITVVWGQDSPEGGSRKKEKKKDPLQVLRMGYISTLFHHPTRGIPVS